MEYVNAVVELVPTIAILQLNKEGVFIHEVIKVCNDVVVLQHGQDANFICDISTFLFRERIQVHLLPHHQRVVLERYQCWKIKQMGDRQAKKAQCMASGKGPGKNPDLLST